MYILVMFGKFTSETVIGYTSNSHIPLNAVKLSMTRWQCMTMTASGAVVCGSVPVPGRTWTWPYMDQAVPVPSRTCTWPYLYLAMLHQSWPVMNCLGQSCAVWSSICQAGPVSVWPGMSHVWPGMSQDRHTGPRTGILAQVRLVM